MNDDIRLWRDESKFWKGFFYFFVKRRQIFFNFLAREFEFLQLKNMVDQKVEL